MGKNDITGDSIITGPTSQEYLDGYDRIFKKPISSEEENLPDDIYSFILENTYTSAVETALLQVLKTALGSDI